jgi:Ni/Fe-hydrogenase 1 B-type cytochrome subunit
MAASRAVEARHPRRHRILHEIIITSIILLILTGFYIHRPFNVGINFMTIARGVHTFSAAVLVVAALLRVRCMFFGSTRDCRLFIPTWKDLKKLPAVINYYAYIGKEPVITTKYNPLQMLTYCLVIVLVLFQIVSGLALLFPESWMSWFNYHLFSNEVQSRMAHYVVNWLFVMFIMIHVYMSIREKPQEIKEMHFFLGKGEG